MALDRSKTAEPEEETSAEMTSALIELVSSVRESTTTPAYADILSTDISSTDTLSTDTLSTETLSHCNGMNVSSNCTPPSCEPCGFCHYDEHTVFVVGYFATCVIVFGLIANGLNARIFTHRFMRNSLLNWYYAALSMSDLFMLSISFFRDCLPRLSDHARQYAVYSAMSWLTPTTQTLGCCAQTCSVFLTVAMSAHRFVGVCFPFKSNRICSKTNTRFVLGSVIVFAILFNVIRAFEVKTIVFECDTDNITEPAPTDVRLDQYYMTYYLGWAYTFVMYVIPFSLLISLNIKVLLAIRNTSKLHRRMSIREANASKRREYSKEISTSVMLIGVVIVFLVCNTPAFMANMIEVLHLVEKGNLVFSKIVDYNNLLVLVNASINCLVYLSFSDKYRALLKHYLSCGCLHDSEPLVDMTSAAA